MEYVLTGFPHGNGPYARCLDIGFALNDIFVKNHDEEFGIIVPLLYGDRQKKIIEEDFGELLNKNPKKILFDKKYGEIQKEVVYDGKNFFSHLEQVLLKHYSVEDKLRNHLSGKIELENIEGKKININSEQINIEITHNPRFSLGIKNSFYTTIAYFSEILKNARKEELPEYAPNILDGVEQIAKHIEDDKKIHFMPEPFVFSYNKNRQKTKEIFTPPLIHFPEINKQNVEKGIYVMVSGIPGLKTLFSGIQKFGLQIYCPPFISDIRGSINKFDPTFVSNQNIEYQYARTGWSSVWLSMITETPLISPKFEFFDDPEIYFNERTVKKLGLAVVDDNIKTPEKLLVEADNLRNNLSILNKKIITNYKTLDGINYTAEIIAKYLEGKNIDKYRKINPILQGYDKNEKYTNN